MLLHSSECIGFSTRDSIAELCYHSPDSSMAVRFASVEGSSLEEKIAFLAEQRERGLDRCEAFAREVEGAMESEMRRRFCGTDYHDDIHHGIPAVRQSAFSGASPRCGSPFDANTATASTLTLLPRPNTVSTSNEMVPRQTRHRPLSMDSIPELQQPRPRCGIGRPKSADCQHHDDNNCSPKSVMRTLTSEARCAVKSTSSDTPGAAGAISPSWLADLKYYEGTSPTDTHGRNSGKERRRATFGASGGIPLQVQGRRDTRTCASAGGYCHHDPTPPHHQRPSS